MPAKAEVTREISPKFADRMTAFYEKQRTTTSYHDATWWKLENEMGCDDGEHADAHRRGRGRPASRDASPATEILIT